MNGASLAKKEKPMPMTVESLKGFHKWQAGPPTRSKGSDSWIPRQILFWIGIACISGLALGLTAYYLAVGPLERSLIDVEVRSIARDVDNVIRVRAATIELAAGNLNVEKLTDAGQLDNLLKAIRKAFPDFRSMEILDEHGEVLALVGELPLSEARHGMRRSKAARVGTMSYRDTDMFLDAPESSSFVIMLKHEVAEGKAWFSRTRFSRDPIKQALSTSGNGLVAFIKPVAEENGQNSSIATMFANWLGSGSSKEVRLHSPGWAVAVSPPSKATSWKRVSAMVCVLVALVAALFYGVRRFRSRGAAHTTDSITGTHSSLARAPALEMSEAAQSTTLASLRPAPPGPRAAGTPPLEEYDRATQADSPIGLNQDADSQSAPILREAAGLVARGHPETDMFGPARCSITPDPDYFSVSVHQSAWSDRLETSTVTVMELARPTDLNDFPVLEYHQAGPDSTEPVSVAVMELVESTELNDFTVLELDPALTASPDPASIAVMELAQPTDLNDFALLEHELPVPSDTDTAEAPPDQEIPDILELTWFEPCEEVWGKAEPEQSIQSGPARKPMSTEVPEFLEVTWSESPPEQSQAIDEDDIESAKLFDQRGA